MSDAYVVTRPTKEELTLSVDDDYLGKLFTHLISVDTTKFTVHVTPAIEPYIKSIGSAYYKMCEINGKRISCWLEEYSDNDVGKTVTITVYYS